jgi:hypothetical protein
MLEHPGKRLLPKTIYALSTNSVDNFVEELGETP